MQPTGDATARVCVVCKDAPAHLPLWFLLAQTVARGGVGVIVELPVLRGGWAVGAAVNNADEDSVSAALTEVTVRSWAHLRVVYTSARRFEPVRVVRAFLCALCACALASAVASAAPNGIRMDIGVAVHSGTDLPFPRPAPIAVRKRRLAAFAIVRWTG
jgi:hypothetical protein